MEGGGFCSVCGHQMTPAAPMKKAQTASSKPPVQTQTPPVRPEAEIVPVEVIVEADDEVMLFCTNCGAELVEEAVFCIECGHFQESSVTSGEAGPVEEPAPEPQPTEIDEGIPEAGSEGAEPDESIAEPVEEVVDDPTIIIKAHDNDNANTVAAPKKKRGRPKKEDKEKAD